MRESLDIDPILREFLEQRRGLTGDEIQRLLVEWNNQGPLLEFLASKALIDRTTARMLTTAAKGLLVSTPDELRTVLGVRLRRQKPAGVATDEGVVADVNGPAAHAAQAPALASQPGPTVAAQVSEQLPDQTPPTQPNQTVRDAPSSKEEEPRTVQDSTSPGIAPRPVPSTEQTSISEPRQVKKGSGRRGFLGASDEEMRHILGARSGDGGRTAKSDQPSAAAATPTSAAVASAPLVSQSAPPAIASTPSAPASPGSSSPPVSTPVTARPVPASRSKPDLEPKPSKKHPTMSDPQISAVHSAPDLLPIKPPGAGSEPKVGMYLDRYYLEESIGEGATATIFRSFHKLLRIPVAIKIYKREAMADDPIGVQRFLSEAQILIRLEHPNIVRVLDIAVRDGAPYIVFEYVGELSLQGMINNMGLLPPLRIAQIGAQVAGALEAASSSGLLHRDVKPDNILIRKDGLAKLADFGIATHRASDGRTADELARAGLISGTPQYISPEQITTPDQIDFRADIYSLGATLYHAACGHPPFERDSIDELLHAQLEDFPIPLQSLDPNFDPELSEIIAKMLNKEPVDRFVTLAELRRRLESVANRIQGEVSERRRNAMSSGAMPTFVMDSAQSSSPRAVSEERPGGALRERSGSVPLRSGSASGSVPKGNASDGQLMLRESSSGLRAVVMMIAALVVCLVLYVLVRTTH